MYVPAAFRMDDADAIEHLRQRGFGLLVLPTLDAPAASHVPFLVESTADGSHRIALHLARANKLHSPIGAGCNALLVCQGPDAYISPDWYGVPNQVPTWTYTSVHVTGTARVLSEVENLAHVDRLSAEFENRLLPKKPWTSNKMDNVRRSAMLNAIVSIAIDVNTIEAQKKLIQYKGEIEHRGAIAGLRARDDAGSQAIASMMEKSARQRFGG
jgi:transcriptional regulator